MTTAGVCSGLTLEGIRVGEHPYFTRIVLDFDGPVSQYRVYRGPSGRTLWVVTPSGVAPGLLLPDRLPPGLAGLSLSSIGKADSRFLVGVLDGSKVRSFTVEADSREPHRLVLDILRPTPPGQLHEIERLTAVADLPWRPVAVYSPATEIQPMQLAEPVRPPSLPPDPVPDPARRAAPPKGAAAAEATPLKPGLSALPAPPAELPKPLSSPLKAEDAPSQPARTASDAPGRRAAAKGPLGERIGRFLRGADVEGELPNVHGPIPLRFNNPLHVLLYQFIPDQAKLLEREEHAFRLDFNQTHALGQLNAVNEGDGTSPIDPSVPLRIFTHLEASAFRLHYDYGVLDRLQAGIELPILYHHVNSFANELKEAYEKYISGKRSLLNVILNKRPDLRSTRFFIEDGDKTLFDSDTDTAGLGEMALRAKFRLLRESRWIPETSFRAGLKLPTATNDQFGSGGVDGALGLLLQKSFWDSFIAYFNYSATLPSDPFDSKSLNPQGFFTYWTIALEWDFLKRWALVGQFSGSSAPYEAPPGTQENTSLTELIAAPSYVMGGGLRVALDPRWMVMGGFQTDVVGRVGATADETTLFVSLEYRIPARWTRR
ncbi:MAG: hypothetical protein HYY21_01310 [Candidatus Tectomicrobia bacterium]|nr:hypothetical protein [Candidatus Tectomicrobia bacterium]